MEKVINEAGSFILHIDYIDQALMWDGDALNCSAFTLAPRRSRAAFGFQSMHGISCLFLYFNPRTRTCKSILARW
jgi:hypothetical protein